MVHFPSLLDQVKSERWNSDDHLSWNYYFRFASAVWRKYCDTVWCLNWLGFRS